MYIYIFFYLWGGNIQPNVYRGGGKCQTCVLFAQIGHNLRGSLQVSLHVFVTQPSDHHTHPLQGGGEGELTHDADLTGLRRKRHVQCKRKCWMRAQFLW